MAGCGGGRGLGAVGWRAQWGVLVQEGHLEEPGVGSSHTAQRREHNREDEDPRLLMRGQMGGLTTLPEGLRPLP